MKKQQYFIPASKEISLEPLPNGDYSLRLSRATVKNLGLNSHVHCSIGNGVIQLSGVNPALNHAQIPLLRLEDFLIPATANVD